MIELPENTRMPESHAHRHSFAKQEVMPLPRLKDWLVKGLKTLFSPNGHKQEQVLVGRIQKLRTEAKEVCKELRIVKKRFKQELDDDLYQSFKEIVMKPILTDIRTIRQGLKTTNPQKQSMLEARYLKRKSQAELLVELGEDRVDEKMVRGAILAQVQKKASERIDNDIHMINSYLDQTINEIEHLAVRQEIAAVIQEDIERLVKLKEIPPPKTLEEIPSWRENCAGKRSKIVSRALNQIDEQTRKYF